VTASLLLTAALFVPQPTPHPVRWGSWVAPPGRAALEKALQDRPRRMEAHDALVDHDEKGREHRITTCDQYEKAKKGGWSAENNAQIATESFFIAGCDIPQMLLKAKPSATSYLDDFHLDASALDVLPAGIAGLADDSDALQAAEKKGASLKQYAPDLKVQVKETHDDRLVVQGEEARYDLEVAGFGDFNGDGIEDVLIFQASYAVGGSMHIYEPVILTRTKPGAPLRTVGAR
jgi:hypothetical protein